MIQRRLDFWLTSSSLQEDIQSVDIIPAIKSDHSAITLFIKGIEDERHAWALLLEVQCKLNR